MNPPVTKKVHKVAAVGFELQTKNYAEARPSYPAQAIERLCTLFPPPSKVLDLAAGTGIMTKLLMAVGYDVIAVEPSQAMREQFRKAVPNVEIREGSSWKIPHDDASLDLVIVAQAFHWFDDLDSLREMYRVLKSNGSVVLIWNMESPRSEWVTQLRRIYETFDDTAPQYRKGRWRQVFETQEAKDLFALPFDRQMFTNDYKVKKSDVWRRVLSKSYISQLDALEQSNLKERVEAIINPLEAEDEEDRILYPHDTEMVWFQKRCQK